MASNTQFRGSPRFLTLQHALGVRKANSKDKNKSDQAPPPPAGVNLPPKGHEQLYSYFSPALVGGDYVVTSIQTVDANGQTLTPAPKTSKDFVVEAPRFVLPDGAVHSVYPPSGAQTSAETLPHVLFTDPYLPWERDVVTDEGAPRKNDKSKVDRNRTPWVALIAFSEAELLLTDDVLDPSTGLLKDTTIAREAKAKIQQSPTLSINMKVSDVPRNLSTIKTPIPLVSDANDASSDVIFVPTHLFDLLTTNYTPGGDPIANQELADVSRYTYLSHVRYSNAEGMEATEDDGLFAVTLSHRVGPMNADKASRTIAHLVSLERWHQMKRADTAGSRYVALTSLYSWSYDTLSTGAVNISKAFKAIGEGRNVLSLPLDMIDTIKPSPESQRIKDRLKDGYTLTRYITQTGEETAAIFRGALIPSKPHDSLGPKWTGISFSGANLQIFDKEAGLMDLTYSTAWTLGKTLALADQVFTTSLARFRAMHDASALNEAKQHKLAKVHAWTPRNDTVSVLADVVGALAQSTHPARTEPEQTDTAAKPNPTDLSAVDISRTDPAIAKKFEAVVEKKVQESAGSKDPKGSKFYNELNKPNSTDWMIIITWLIDKMYLFNIPAQYLLPEPGCLPNESLRFFYVDPHWRNAFIDGALSLANHLNRGDDVLRRKMTDTINDYFSNKDESLGYNPQRPAYGFLLRSDLVRIFPDMHITAPIPQPQDPTVPGPHRRAPVLRNERLAEDVLLCLFDRQPGSTDLPMISFTQPAHQQFFVVGDSISKGELKTAYKHVHSQAPKDGVYGTYDALTLKAAIDPEKPVTNRIFIWGENQEARFLNLNALTADLTRALGTDPVTYNDSIVTAAVVGYQLACPVYQLNILDDAEASRIRATRQSGRTHLSRTVAMIPETVPAPVAVNVANIQDLHSLRDDDLQMLEDSVELPLNSLTLRAGIERPAKTMESSKISSMMIASSSSGSSVPKFAWLVYPIETYNRPIPTDNGALDLVFSIRILDAADFGKRFLTEIKIQIPIGPMNDANGNAQNRLMKSYDGPGPVMLSNLRWNVVMTQRKRSDYLEITLLPRSTKNGVLVSRAKDNSFILPLVKVNEYIDKAYVDINHWESYASSSTQTDHFPVTLMLSKYIAPLV